MSRHLLHQSAPAPRGSAPSNHSPAFPRSEPAKARRDPPADRGRALDIRLERAQRLGHCVGVQRYFSAADLGKSGSVPPSARISENLGIVSEGKQDVFAYDSSIDEANKILKSGSRVVLDKGERKDYDMELPADEQGFSTITFDDFYRVVPRFNPDVDSVGSDLSRQHSPESTDNPQAVERKHVAYVNELAQLGEDYSLFMEEVDRGRRDKEYAAEFGGVATVETSQWLMEISKWLGRGELRRQVLTLNLQEIAATFDLEGDLSQRRQSLAKLGDSLAKFIQREVESPNKISLPTDCAQCVSYVTTGGKTVEDDSLRANPGIGSNYFTKLPANAANVGWNFHWAGVILKDGSDNVTLESAGGTSLGSLGKSSWWMEMYGTKIPDQTFKKRIHQIHIRRNRDNIATIGDRPDTQKAKLELDAHELIVAGWTNLTSDL